MNFTLIKKNRIYARKILLSRKGSVHILWVLEGRGPGARLSARCVPCLSLPALHLALPGATGEVGVREQYISTVQVKRSDAPHTDPASNQQKWHLGANSDQYPANNCVFKMHKEMTKSAVNLRPAASPGWAAGRWKALTEESGESSLPRAPGSAPASLGARKKDHVHLHP